MSSSKKPTGIILFLLLLFVVAGVLGYVYSTNKSSDDVMDIDVTASEQSDDSATMSTAAPTVGRAATVKPLSIKENLGRRGIGDPNAPVKVQEFYSLTCNHCANFYKGAFQELKTKYIDTGKIYFIYEEFPLNGPALYGSMIARCLPEDRYPSFVGMLLETQEKWAFGGDFKEALKQDAALAGMNEEEFEACFNNKELQQEIANNIQEVNETWKVQSTPTFVFNDGEIVLDGGHEISSFDQVYAQLTGEEVPATETPVEAPSEAPADEAEEE